MKPFSHTFDVFRGEITEIVLVVAQHTIVCVKIPVFRRAVRDLLEPLDGLTDEDSFTEVGEDLQGVVRRYPLVRRRFEDAEPAAGGGMVLAGGSSFMGRRSARGGVGGHSPRISLGLEV